MSKLLHNIGIKKKIGADTFLLVFPVPPLLSAFAVFCLGNASKKSITWHEKERYGGGGGMVEMEREHRERNQLKYIKIKNNRPKCLIHDSHKRKIFQK